MIDLLWLAMGWMLAGIAIAWIIGGASRSEESASLRDHGQALVLLRGGSHASSHTSGRFATHGGRERRLGDWRVFVTAVQASGSNAPAIPRSDSGSSGRG
jgi:hypothetical protein